MDSLSNINASVSFLYAKLQGWVNGFVALIPNLVAAVAVLLVFWIVSRLVAVAIRKSVARAGRPTLAGVLASLGAWAMVILGFLLAATIVLPSLKPGDLVSGLGIGSVAIGFAFKDILQNLLSGVLILLRQPFKVGDQIKVGDYEGTVEDIETRATILKTYDGRRVVIPNADIYTRSVIVNTAHPLIRSQYDIGIGYGDDWDEAMEVMLEAARGCEGVEPEPAPEALPVGLDESQKTVRLRWWTKSTRTDTVHTSARVLRDVSNALKKAGIDLPYPTQVMLMHDQTEETDGDRKAQREGWPAGKAAPKSARAVREAREDRLARAAAKDGGKGDAGDEGGDGAPDRHDGEADRPRADAGGEDAPQGGRSAPRPGLTEVPRAGT